MKILLDENIDVRLKIHLDDTGHEVYTIRDMKWNGIKNGALIQLLKEHEFGCWIVVDKNIPYQQNVGQLPCIVIVLDVFRNTLGNLKPLVPKILTLLSSPLENKIIVISSP